MAVLGLSSLNKCKTMFQEVHLNPMAPQHQHQNTLRTHIETGTGTGNRDIQPLAGVSSKPLRSAHPQRQKSEPYSLRFITVNQVKSSRLSSTLLSCTRVIIHPGLGLACAWHLAPVELRQPFIPTSSHPSVVIHPVPDVICLNSRQS